MPGVRVALPSLLLLNLLFRLADANTDDPIVATIQLAHAPLHVRASSLANRPGSSDDYSEALAAAALASPLQVHALSDLIFHKSKFVTRGSHANGSRASFSLMPLTTHSDDSQFFVQWSSHCDVHALLALQLHARGRIVARVQDRLFIAIGSHVFAGLARQFPGVAWVQERDAGGKVGARLQNTLRLISEQIALKSNQKSVKIIAECWFDGCGDAAVAVQPACPDVYVHPTLVEARCSPRSLAAVVRILAAHISVDHVSIKPVAAFKNFGGRSVIGSGPDALLPTDSLVLNINVSGSLIGVGDSGLDVNNCFFYDNSTQPPWRNSRVVQTYDVQPCEMCGKCCGASSPHGCSNITNACGNYIEESSHGSHVSATIAGVGPGSVSYGNGVAAGAKLHFLDFQNILSDTQCYSPGECGPEPNTPTDLYNLFRPQFDAGARISSNSWSGEDKGVYSQGCRMIDAFVAAHPTFLVVFAAGNAGQSEMSGTVEEEGGCKNCLSVGASQLSDALFRTMHSYDDDGSFCSQKEDGSVLLDPCCKNSTECVQRCCGYTSALNMSLSCCAEQTTCGGKSSCTVASGNIRSARNVASFSSRGPTLDGRFKPDIVAPGESIMSAFAPDQRQGKFRPTTPNHCGLPSKTRARTPAESFNMAFKIESGTSMAAPLVAGAAEKIRQYFVQGYYPQGSAGSGASFEPEEALVRAVVIASCSCAMTDSEWGVWTKDRPNDREFVRYPLPRVTPNIFHGFGLPVLDRAVYMAGGSSAYNMLFTNSVFYFDSDAVAYNVSCSPASSTPLALVLVWTDPPGSVNSQSPLVNDLDLIVLVPGSAPPQLFGNMRQFADSTNTVEKVITKCPPSGLVTVVVVPARLASASQAWYLVANGPVSAVIQAAVPSFSSGRSSISVMTQSQPCFLQVGTVFHVKFKSQAWSCVGLTGTMDCNFKGLAFALMLAQVIRVPASSITFLSSDSSGLFIVLQCGSFFTSGQTKFVSSSSIFDAVQSYCKSFNSPCITDPVLGDVDWSTLAISAPPAARLVMSVSAYRDKSCTDAPFTIGSPSASNPFAFDDASCYPGATFGHNQLYFKAVACTSAVTFAAATNNPACNSTSDLRATSKVLSFNQSVCISAKEVFDGFQIRESIDELRKRNETEVPQSFTFACRIVSSSLAPASPSASLDCTHGRLCLAIPDSLFYIVICLSATHVVQAVAWAVLARMKQQFTPRRMLVVLLLPVAGLAAWAPLCHFTASARSSRRLLARPFASDTHQDTDKRCTEFTRTTYT